MINFFNKPEPPKDESLELFFIPALVILLIKAEKEKGSALTEVEVLDVRDKGTVVSMPKSLAEKMHKDRGYPDIDPENCWEDWTTRRDEYFSKPRFFDFDWKKD